MNTLTWIQVHIICSCKIKLEIDTPTADASPKVTSKNMYEWCGHVRSACGVGSCTDVEEYCRTVTSTSKAKKWSELHV